MAIVMFRMHSKTIQRKCIITELIRLPYSGHVDNDCIHNISLRLGKWVSTQRVQYKKFMEGKPSQMTQDKIDELNDIGFIWDPLRDAFDLRLSQLVDYKEANGDCNVPHRCKDNPE